MKFAAVALVSLLAITSLGLGGCAAEDGEEDVVASVGEELNAASLWQTLGSREVDGLRDRDTIVVGADEGTFTSIKVRVQGSALLMQDIKIVFGNGETFSPNVSWFFDANTATRTIDLPGNARNIKRVEFKYGNLPGGGNASVQLLGKSGGTPQPWQGLGQRRVDGHFDRDRIIVGADEGRVSAIKLRVEDSSLVMFDIKVTFGNGETFSPNVRLVFDENSASRVIDLPGGARNIKHVEFRYGNIPGGGKARVILSGKSAAPPPWANLGERRVDGRFDGDRIVVGGDEGKFRSIQIRVEDSALVLFDVKVTFGNGQTFSPNTRYVFAEGSATRVIDLPGEARNIARVDFKYGNLPTGGAASVQLWGKR